LIDKRADASIKTDNGRTALHVAASNNSLCIFNEIRELGLDVNAQTSDLRRTALHVAVLQRHKFVIESLLEFPGLHLEQKDYHGDTAVALAAKTGSLHILRLLCEKLRSCPQASSLLGEAFLAAVKAVQDEAALVLIKEFGVSPGDHLDALGNSALHTCSLMDNHILVAKLLDSWGSNLQVALGQKNLAGHTPQEVADIQGYERVLRCFNAHCRKQRERQVAHSQSSQRSGGWCSCPAKGEHEIDIRELQVSEKEHPRGAEVQVSEKEHPRGAEEVTCSF